MYFLFFHTYEIQAIIRQIEAGAWLETPGPHRSGRVIHERIYHCQTRCTKETELMRGRIYRDISRIWDSSYYIKDTINKKQRLHQILHGTTTTKRI